MSTLKRGELPPGDLVRAGRHYIFQPRDNAVAVEDIFIAASLLCRGHQYNAGRIEREFVPGQFSGTDLGRITSTGEKVFLFIIRGDVTELTFRKRLIHKGAHLIDTSEFKVARSRLLDELTEAKRAAEIIEKQDTKLGGAEDGR